MKKFILLSIIIVFGFLVVLPALAAPSINDLTGQVAGNAGYDTNVGPGDFSTMIGRLIRSVLGFVGVIFLALTVYAGILWMTASGNEEQVGTAVKILKAAVIGMAIALSAYSISVAVITITNPAFSSGAKTGGAPCSLGSMQYVNNPTGVGDKLKNGFYSSACLFKCFGQTFGGFITGGSQKCT